MLYLLAAVGALTIAVLLWRAFGAQSAGVTTRRERRVIAPDDDPEFLRGLTERNKKAGEDPPA
ncbi:hypothetical protein KIPE111705_18315 [Kibdelosporangium persicum]|uniref:Secreted protein n=1 Tax=Kibdelosporangium persicum TaxID=2698649 RepID=A0ABX2FCV0_9PSEU|nr:hypothetical protein [Kibdelosporangium persicum]NRN68580.1 hypothetical protein [Kibdelosporangium persicum]